MFDAKQFNMHNGINLVTIKKETEIFSIHIGIKMGSIYERNNENGISHFVEHMLFKGTKNRDNEKLNNDLEQLGGEYNAYTDYSCTVYSITALCEELKQSVQLLSDMVQNSIFPEEEMEKEREVIFAEIRTSKDDIEDYSFKKINEIAFKYSPLRLDVLGKEKNIKSIDRKKIIEFYKKYYVPNNCYISIVSPYDHEYAYNLIRQYFGSWAPVEFEREKVIVENNIAKRKVSLKKDIEQSTIIYLFTFHSLGKDEELVLKVLNHKLGDSTNSILFRKLREDRGLAYDIYSELDTTNCVKSLYIYTSVAEENVNEALEVIDNCIEDIKKEKIIFDDTTVKHMKKVLKTAVVFTLEDSTDLSNYVLHQILDDDNIYGFINDMKKLDEIKKEHIYDVARKVLNNPTVHILKNED